MCHKILRNHKFQYIRFCDVYYGKHDKKFGVQVNADSHILHITGGHAKIFINSEGHALKRGMVLNIPPFIEVYYEVEPPGFSMLNIHYRMWTSSGDPMENFKELPLIFEPVYFSSCERILKQMKKMMFLPAPVNMEIEMLAHEVVLKHFLSNRLLPARQRSEDVRIDKIYKMLQSPDWLEYDAEKMAKSCFLSVSQMNRKFKHCFNLPPQKFWEKNRFDNVCHALRENDKPLSEIAYDFAFADPAYFSKWFKRAAKITPSEYRVKFSEETGA